MVKVLAPVLSITDPVSLMLEETNNLADGRRLSVALDDDKALVESVRFRGAHGGIQAQQEGTCDKRQ